jgi:hypothetical protein
MGCKDRRTCIDVMWFRVHFVASMYRYYAPIRYNIVMRKLSLVDDVDSGLNKFTVIVEAF